MTEQKKLNIYQNNIFIFFNFFLDFLAKIDYIIYMKIKNNQLIPATGRRGG